MQTHCCYISLLLTFVSCYLASDVHFFLEQATNLTYLFPMIHICTPAGNYLLKVNNKDTRTTPMSLNMLKKCSNFEHVNDDWYLLKTFENRQVF